VLSHAGVFILVALAVLLWQGGRIRFLANLLRRAK
jgi:hypothetical protein